MSIVPYRRPPINPEPPCCSPAEAAPCVQCTAGTEDRDIGEPIPARLSADDLESIVRFGFVGDEPVEPMRLAGPLDPEQLEELADRLELAYIARTGRNDAPGYQIGFLISRYRGLYQLYQDTLRRLEESRFEFWPDETPELADQFFGRDDEANDELEHELASTES